MKDKNMEKIKQSKKTGRAAKTKKSEKRKSGNVASQKRFVSPVRVFLTDEEKEAIREKVGNFKSLSNYIRHHLGLPINTVGRKKRHIKSALDLDLDEPEKPGEAAVVRKVEKKPKPEQVKEEIEILSCEVSDSAAEELRNSPEVIKEPTGKREKISGNQRFLWDKANQPETA